MTFDRTDKWAAFCTRLAASELPLSVLERIQYVDLHTAGEPVRIAVEGGPKLRGETLLARRHYAEQNADGLRRALMLEPRGHSEMYGVIPMDPIHPDAVLSVLFMHNAGYSTMCGHAIIALGKLAVLTGLVPVTEPETAVIIDAPAGQIHAWTEVVDGQPGRVRFHNVPSFAPILDGVVEEGGGHRDVV